MNFQKQVLATLKGCYSCNSIELDGRTNILLASEGENACLAWRAPDYKQSHTVWEGPGGTMSIVPIPGTNGEFLAVQKFFRMFDWEEAKVVHVRPQANGGYEVTDVVRCLERVIQLDTRLGTVLALILSGRGTDVDV